MFMIGPKYVRLPRYLELNILLLNMLPTLFTYISPNAKLHCKAALSSESCDLAENTKSTSAHVRARLSLTHPYRAITTLRKHRNRNGEVEHNLSDYICNYAISRRPPRQLCIFAPNWSYITCPRDEGKQTLLYGLTYQQCVDRRSTGADFS